MSEKQTEIPFHYLTTQGGFSVAWFKQLFLYIGLSVEYQLRLRLSCRLFRDAIPALVWTMFPPAPTNIHHGTTITNLLERMNHAHQQNPSKSPTILYLREGTHVVDENECGTYPVILMKYPITIIGQTLRHCLHPGQGAEEEGEEEEEGEAGEEGVNDIRTIIKGGGIISRKDVQEITMCHCIYEKNITAIKQKEVEENYLKCDIDFVELQELVAEWNEESENEQRHEEEMSPISTEQLEMERHWVRCAEEWYEQTGLLFENYYHEDPNWHQDVGVLYELIEDHLHSL